MKSIFTAVAGAVLACVLACGCQTSPKKAPPSAAKSGTTKTNSGPAALDERNFEKRAEADARFLAGMVHELNDEPEAAVEDFYAAALAHPQDERLVLDLTTRFIFLKRFDRAAELLAKALERPGASASLDTRLAFIQLQRGKTNEAIRANEAAIKKAPQFMGGYQGLYLLHVQAGQTNEARKTLERAAAVKNPDAGFLVDLSELYFLENRAARGSNQVVRTKARDALTRAAKQNPTNFFVLQKLADGFTQLGDSKQAAAVLIQLQKHFPEMPNVRERLVNLYLRDKDKQGAAEQLEALIRENPTDPQGYYLLGILAFDDQQFKEAADHFRKTLLLKPDFEPAYYELAVCQINQKEAKEALETLDKARARFKETFLSEYFSSLAFMRLKDYTNAVSRMTAAEVIARATDTNRLTHIFYFQYGSACERAGRWDEGEKHLLTCLKLSPDFVEALNYLGYMYAERGTNLPQARVMIEKALKAEPDNAAYLDSLGWIDYKEGKYREALKHIQRAVELEKEPDATLYDHLGDIHAALKDMDKAREAWRKSLSLEPSPAVQKKLDGAKP